MSNIAEYEIDVGFDTVLTTSLGLLIHDGKTDEIEKRLNEPINWDEEHYYPLHAALYAGRDDIALKLTELGSPVFSQSFYLAQRFGNPKTFAFLLEKHVDKIDGISSNNTFIDATRNGNVKVARALIRHIDNINTTDYFYGFKGWTALHHATNDCNAEMVILLLGHGSDVNIRTEEGKTPLVICHRYNRKVTRQERKKVVQLLLEQGAEVAGDLTPWQMFWLKYGFVV